MVRMEGKEKGAVIWRMKRQKGMEGKER